MRRTLVVFLVVWVAMAAQAGAEPRLALLVPAPITDQTGYLDPAWTPDGREVSFSGLRYRGIYAVPQQGGEIRTVVPPDLGISGFRHRWLEGPTRLLCPARGDKAANVFVPEGQASGGSPPREKAFVLDDDLWWREPEGDNRLTWGEDRFFDPQVSPDGQWVAVVGLADGIHLVEVDSGRIVMLGPGTHPAWTPDSAWLLFERTEDDGHAILGSEILAHQIESGVTVALTDTPEAIEMHPSVSPDGTSLAFVRDGAIWVGPLVEEP